MPCSLSVQAWCLSGTQCVCCWASRGGLLAAALSITSTANPSLIWNLLPSTRHLVSHVNVSLSTCLQDYTGAGLASKVASKQVDTAALAAMMTLLGQQQQEARQPAMVRHAWIAGPVIGGVAAVAIVVAIVCWLHRKISRESAPQLEETSRPAQQSAVPAPAPAVDGGVKVRRRVEDKYAVPAGAAGSVSGGQHEAASSDGGTPRSTAGAQVSSCAVWF